MWILFLLIVMLSRLVGYCCYVMLCFGLMLFFVSRIEKKCLLGVVRLLMLIVLFFSVCSVVMLVVFVLSRCM